MSESLTIYVFAPTNQAFAQPPQEKITDLLKPENRDQLKQLVSVQVFPGKLSVEDMKKATAIKTEAGREVRVTLSPDLKEIELASARVTQATASYSLDAWLQATTRASAAA